MASPCESCIRSSLSTCPEGRGTNAALQRLVAQQDVNLHKQRCFAQASDRDRQAQRVPHPKAQDLESLSRGEGGVVMGGGGGLCEGVSGGGSPPADFSIPAGGFSGGFFWRIFPLYFATKKNPPQNPPQNPPLRGEFLFQKSPGLEAPEIHRPPPPPGRSNPTPVRSGLGPSLFRVGVSRKRLQV